MVGVEIYKEMLDKNKDRPILLYGDPDVDGLVSLKFLTDFAEIIGGSSPKIGYVVNDNRQHGFFIEPSKLKGWLVISADFGITQEEMQTLVDNDVVVLATDHHEIQDELILCDDSNGEHKGIMINNQYPFEPEENKYLSGAGVFYELIYSLYPEFKTPERDALVGITLLSDVCPIENNVRARQYLTATYGADATHGYLQHLVMDSLGGANFNFGVPRLDNNFINFTLSPLLNSLLRFDRKEEAIAFILDKGKNYDCSTRNLQKALVSYMQSTAQTLEYENLSIMKISYEQVCSAYKNVKPQNFVGVACTQYMSANGNKSTFGFVVDKDGNILRASFRGRYSDISYIRSFISNGFDARGHTSAFGVVNLEVTADTWNIMAELVKDLEVDHATTFHIIDTSNLVQTIGSCGMDIATTNGYVRDSYRTYFRYTGNNIKKRRETYQGREMTMDEIRSGVTPDDYKDGVPTMYILDENGKKIPKYIEFEVDGRLVKSFGTTFESPNAVILPLLVNGYLQLYLNELKN